MSTLATNEAHIEVAEKAEAGHKPTICIPTTRNFARNAFRCAMYEAEDVLADCANVDLLYLKPDKHFQIRSELQWKLLYHDASRRLAYLNPGLQRIHLAKDYDLLVLLCPIDSDPLNINAIRGWKERCRISVCWINELFLHNVPHYKHWLHLLREFDYVVLASRGSVEAVSEAIGRRCYYVPSGVDALRFCPYPNPPARVIDIYSIGRRVKAIHESLLKLASRGKIFYIHDTLHNLANSQVTDYREHRNHYASVAKRSRFFMVAPGFVDNFAKARGQLEVGFRYLEGSAAGAVLIGQAPDSDTFRRSFGWPDAVIKIKPDGTDVTNVVANLLTEPERVLEISRRNTVEALLHHDWIYRWREIFTIAGLKPPSTLAAREKRLHALAGSTTHNRLD